jgi:hypothetical protein
METITLSRQDLYDRVWSKPIHQLSKELGLSDVGLAKLCRRHQIPVPGRGYWEKKRYGHDVQQQPLPALAGTERHPIAIHGRDRPIPHSPDDNLAAQIAFERRSDNRISVPPEDEMTHWLLEGVEAQARVAKADAEGVVKALRGGVSIQVTRPLLPRAVRLTQVLLAALEQRRWLGAIAGDASKTTVTVNGETLAISVNETSKLVPHRLTSEERMQIEKGWSAQWLRKYDEVPAGGLALSISYPPSLGVRRTWKDDGRHQVEEHLNAFMIGLLRAAAIRLKRASKERYEREQAAEERRWRDAKRLELQQQAFVALLDEQADEWSRLQRLRQYLSALEEHVSRGVDDQTERNWLTCGRAGISAEI